LPVLSQFRLWAGSRASITRAGYVERLIRHTENSSGFGWNAWVPGSHFSNT